MKKSELSEAYEKYLWPKCSRTTYYKNIRAGMNFIDALKPVPHTKRYHKGMVKTKRFADELKRYYDQPWDKVSKSRFYQRLYQWWCKEEAIKIDAPIHYKWMPKKVKPQYVRPITPTIKDEIDPDTMEITVKYSVDEALVFKAEYEKIINDLHQKYYATDDTLEAREINNKLDLLVKEYQKFRLLNGV